MTAPTLRHEDWPACASPTPPAWNGTVTAYQVVITEAGPIYLHHTARQCSQPWNVHQVEVEAPGFDYERFDILPDGIHPFGGGAAHALYCGWRDNLSEAV